ncbi:MAG: hypothetical protein ABR524_06685 [Thermoanaerobaculia bacterium]
MRGEIALALLVFGTLAGAAPPPPSVHAGADGSAAITLSAKLLDEAEVRKHVMSGLTMNLLLSLRDREPYGQISIRFEPWDEVFYVRALGADGSDEKKVIRSFEALKKWWSAPRSTPAASFSPGERLKVSVAVIPFSASEEADAKRWLAQSLSVSAPPRVEGGGEVASAPPSLFSAVIGSSIRRRPVLRFEWTVAVQRAAP